MASSPNFKIIRLTKPEALYLPLVHELFLKALERGAIDKEASIRWVWEKLQQKDPHVAVFIGLQDGLPAAMATIVLPYNPKTTRPVLDLLTGNGRPELTRAVIGAGVDFIKRAGYANFWCFNFSKHSDEAYLRAMRRMVGKKGRVRATMMEMDI